MTKANNRVRYLPGSSDSWSAARKSELEIATWCGAPLAGRFNASRLQRFNLDRGFTLLELLIVVGIIGLLLVLMAPAFTTIKGGTDVTSAAYTIKGVLDTARTYAKANNTYTWVGFFEEDASLGSTSPATGGPGRRCDLDRGVKGRERGVHFSEQPCGGHGYKWDKAPAGRKAD